jgi:hypothetical protein
MTRKLKMSLAALLVVTAIGAAGAAPAGASEFEFQAESYPAKVIGTATAAHKFTVDAGTLECKTASFPSELVGPSETLFFKPAFEGCTLAGFPVTFEANECRIYFDQDTYTEKTLEFDVSTKIDCPVGSEMTFTGKAAGTAKCTVHVPEQELGTGVSMLEKLVNGVEDLSVGIFLGAIKYDQTEGTGLGKCATKDATETGIYTGSSTFIAYEKAGPAIDLWAEVLP